MDVIEALKSRHSTRAYQPKAVDKETILKIMEGANSTPSWANTQPWEVFVAVGKTLDSIRSRYREHFTNQVPLNPDIPRPQQWPEAHQERTREMGAAHLKLLGIDRDDQEARAIMVERNLNFFGAPAVIFLCLDKDLSQWSLYDLGSFSQSIMLAAQHYGLNTIPAIMLVAYPDVIRTELKIPAHLNIAMGIALGYGDSDHIESKFITTRRPVAEFVRISGIE
ncbi:nitroreductase [Candidatus Formimonas warabiya]|uniref:Nitroreductase domain-containing protein n=1 Tax=Formimonas warabiya TaxID=1761012 RepID=A0A3G1KR46_FORW1|nr:nitroreductase [Candidatus Formimonas warabiya]ATW24934.1 hypothetical protein DCMF_09260 [Candidatus Formimonas warabiya]